MSCASKYDLDVLGTFSSFPARHGMLSKPLCSIVSIVFFLFWVRLWVRRRCRSADKGLTDCTSVYKEKLDGKFDLLSAQFVPMIPRL